MASPSGHRTGLQKFLDRRLAWLDPHAPLTPVQRRWARTGALVSGLYLVAPLVGYLLLVLPAEGRRDLWVFLISTGALLSGIVTLLLFDRLPPWFWHAVTIAGPFSGALLAVSAGSAAPVILMFLSWQPVYCAYMFGGRATIAYTAMSALGIGLYGALVTGPSSMLLALGAFPVLLVPAGLMTLLIRHEQQMSQALREAEAVLAADERFETVGRLAAGVAHDFNNLLTVILARAQIAAARDPEPAMARTLEEIISAVDRASNLTRQLLVFTRGENPGGTAEVIDLASTVQRTVELLSRVLPAHIALEVDVTDERLPVRVDETDLERMVLNLCLNARDAMPQGGVLRVAVEAVAPTGPDEPMTGRLSVSDDGVGMDAETRRRAFEPLYTTRGSGTGLGLASVASTVRDAQGEVTLDSAPGAGTTVTIDLPGVVETRVPVPTGPAPARAPHAPQRVLLVDDQRTLREVTAEGLRSRGHTVLEAGDGADALAVLETDDVDVVVSDVVMPGMDGGALAEEMESRFPSVPLIFLSGYTEDARVRARVATTGAVLLAKPYSLDALEDALVEAARAAGRATTPAH